MSGEIFSFTKSAFLGDELDILVANKELLAKISDRLTSLGWSMGREVADAFQLGESIKLLAEYEARKYAESLRDSWEAGSGSDWCQNPVAASECVSEYGLLTFILELPRCSDDEYSLDLYNFGKREIRRVSVQEAVAAFSYFCAVSCDDLCCRAAGLRVASNSSRHRDIEDLINGARAYHVEGAEALHHYRHPLISRKENYVAPQSYGADIRAYRKDVVGLELHRIVAKILPVDAANEWDRLVDIGRRILSVGRNKADGKERLYRLVMEGLMNSSCLPEGVLDEISEAEINRKIDIEFRDRLNYLAIIVGSKEVGNPPIVSDSDRAIFAWFRYRNQTRRKIRRDMADASSRRIAMKMRPLQFRV
ncbi:hypothetical protein [Ralstonia mojiangensis]|uniref:hypothetical protein n=1 Tax=Ralstonia mojiangensis TaxID=2953895 RepID=UPI0021B47AB0|nr:hypothetical protein [Ralstonia mojiangensis]MCT7325018.1 hypothetical protein [Ralstonia mojiangensis]